MLEIAKRFLGLAEVEGDKDNPFIVWCLSLCGLSGHDEIPWCSAFVFAMAFICGKNRKGANAGARSWLRVGQAVSLSEAKQGDVVIFKRGEGNQPGPEVINAPGHAALYVNHDSGMVTVIGGNQGNKVSIADFPEGQILGIRRLEDI